MEPERERMCFNYTDYTHIHVHACVSAYSIASVMPDSWDGKTWERRRGEHGDWLGAQRGRGYSAMARDTWAGTRGGRVRGDRDLRMGNEAAPGTGHGYTADDAALPAQILPRPAPRGPNLESGLHPCPQGSDPSFRSWGSGLSFLWPVDLAPLFSLLRGFRSTLLSESGVRSSAPSDSGNS